MKKFLMAVACVLLFPFIVFANGEVKSFEYSEGERWRFGVAEKFNASTTEALGGEYEAVYSNGKFQFSFMEGKERIPVSDRQHKILLQIFGLGDVFGGKHIVFPFKVGSTWDVPSYTLTVFGAKKPQVRSGDVIVLSINDATTSDGKTFPKAYQFVRSDRGPGGAWEVTYWVYPPCKCVVKHVLESKGAKRDMWLISHDTPQPQEKELKKLQSN